MYAPPVTADRIAKIAHAFQEAKALLSAVELGIFTVLSEGPLDATTLTERLGINERGARDFFDALVALGLLDRHHDGRYANAAGTALYLDRSKSSYLGGELEFINAQLYARWGSLTAALRSGKPQTDAGAAGNYPTRYADAVTLENFARAMTALTLPVARALATKFPWQDHRTVCDVGGAEGCLPVVLARVHQHLTGGGFDLPPLGPLFSRYIDAFGFSDRLRFHGGDFFHDPLPASDVLVMGRVLHNWDLATKKMLLAKARDALPTGGALIVYDRLIDDERRTNVSGLLASLNMLIMTAGGFDYTGSDCSGWMREIGFRHIRVEPLTAEQSMVVGIK